MTRKGFFRALFGFGATGVAAVEASTHGGWRCFIPRRRLVSRLVAISDCRDGRYVSGTKVFLDGKPVWNDCCYAEEYSNGTGRVILYLRNAEGKFYCLTDRSGMAKKEVVGRVRIIPPSTISPKDWKNLQERWLRG